MLASFSISFMMHSCFKGIVHLLFMTVPVLATSIHEAGEILLGQLAALQL